MNYKALYEKQKEYINQCNKLMGNWESSHISLIKLRAELSLLEKEKGTDDARIAAGLYLTFGREMEISLSDCERLLAFVNSLK